MCFILIFSFSLFHSIYYRKLLSTVTITFKILTDCTCVQCIYIYIMYIYILCIYIYYVYIYIMYAHILQPIHLHSILYKKINQFRTSCYLNDWVHYYFCTCILLFSIYKDNNNNNINIFLYVSSYNSFFLFTSQ